jgi:hypothetical protein
LFIIRIGVIKLKQKKRVSGKVRKKSGAPAPEMGKWRRHAQSFSKASPSRRLTPRAYRYFSGFRRAERIYRLIFIQNARTKYTISGDPIVRKEM